MEIILFLSKLDKKKMQQVLIVNNNGIKSKNCYIQLSNYISAWSNYYNDGDK